MPKLDLTSIPKRKGSSYPAPFDKEPANRIRQRLGDAGGLTQFGVNLLHLPQVRGQANVTGTRRRMNLSTSSRARSRSSPTRPTRYCGRAIARRSPETHLTVTILSTRVPPQLSVWRSAPEPPTISPSIPTSTCYLTRKPAGTRTGMARRIPKSDAKASGAAPRLLAR